MVVYGLVHIRRLLDSDSVAFSGVVFVSFDPITAVDQRDRVRIEPQACDAQPPAKDSAQE